MGRLYSNGELAALMDDIGVVDRFYRFGKSTWEARVTLTLHSEGGRIPRVRLELQLMADGHRPALRELLSTYLIADQHEAHMDGVTVAGKLGLSLLSRDAEGNWQLLADLDTGTVVVPGSVVLWED